MFRALNVHPSPVLCTSLRVIKTDEVDRAHRSAPQYAALGADETRRIWSDMRVEFHAELAEVNRLLVAMAEWGQIAMKRATAALLHADQTEAEEVLSTDNEID